MAYTTEDACNSEIIYSVAVQYFYSVERVPKTLCLTICCIVYLVIVLVSPLY